MFILLSVCPLIVKRAVTMRVRRPCDTTPISHQKVEGQCSTRSYVPRVLNLSIEKIFDWRCCVVGCEERPTRDHEITTLISSSHILN
jgi:hypothetical protein